MERVFVVKTRIIPKHEHWLLVSNLVLATEANPIELVPRRLQGGRAPRPRIDHHHGFRRQDLTLPIRRRRSTRPGRSLISLLPHDFERRRRWRASLLRRRGQGLVCGVLREAGGGGGLRCAREAQQPIPLHDSVGGWERAATESAA